MDMNLVKVILIGTGALSFLATGIWLSTSEKGDSFFSFACRWLLPLWLIFGFGAWIEYDRVLANRRQAEINKRIISLKGESTFLVKGKNELFKLDSLSIDSNWVFSQNKFYPIYKIRIRK